jgi:hypothetical protein
MSSVNRAESESRGVHKVRVRSFICLYWLCPLAHLHSSSRFVDQTNMKLLIFADNFRDASKGIVP